MLTINIATSAHIINLIGFFKPEKILSETKAKTNIIKEANNFDCIEVNPIDNSAIHNITLWNMLPIKSPISDRNEPIFEILPVLILVLLVKNSVLLTIS